MTEMILCSVTCSKITVKTEVGKYNEQDSKAEH